MKSCTSTERSLRSTTSFAQPATPAAPNLGLLLKLEMPEVRKIIGEEEIHPAEGPADPRGMTIGLTSVELPHWANKGTE